MVLVLVIGKTTYYACEECLFIYDNENNARKCEKWCKEHKSCNQQITSLSLGRIIKSQKRLRLG